MVTGYSSLIDSVARLSPPSRLQGVTLSKRAEREKEREGEAEIILCTQYTFDYHNIKFNCGPYMPNFRKTLENLMIP